MYFKLFNIITDSLEENDIIVLKEILKQGQIETEEMYIEGEDE